MMRSEHVHLATRVASLVGVCLMMFTLGYIGSQGNISPYIISYLHKYVDPSIHNSHAVWIAAASLSSQGMLMPLSGLLIHKLGFRLILFVSFLLFSGGCLLSYFTIKANYGSFLLTQCLMLGAGLGCCYSHLLALAAFWFPNQRGFVVGLCVCAFGAGAIVMTPVQTVLINPTNIGINNETQMFEDEGLLHRVPCAFLIIGGILGGLQVISFLIMRPKPFTDNVSEIESESTDSQRNKSDALDKERIEPELQPKQVLKIPDIYILWGIMFFSLFPLTLVQSAIKIIGQSATSDDAYLSIVATIGAVVNAVSRMTWGPVGDALSFKVNYFWGEGSESCLISFIFSISF